MSMSNINYQSAFITNTHLFIDKIYFYNTPLVRSIRVLTTYLLFIISVQNSNRLFSATEAVYIIVNEFRQTCLRIFSEISSEFFYGICSNNPCAPV